MTQTRCGLQALPSSLAHAQHSPLHFPLDKEHVRPHTAQGRTPADRRREAARSERYAYMEKKALQLMSDNKALALALEQTTRRKDMEIKELQAHITTVRYATTRKRTHTNSAPATLQCP